MRKNARLGLWTGRGGLKVASRQRQEIPHGLAGLPLVPVFEFRNALLTNSNAFGVDRVARSVTLRRGSCAFGFGS